jgi:hypothetical protein
MVQAIIDISDRSNRVLNLIKAKYGLGDKSYAIDRLTLEYEQKEKEKDETQMKLQLIQKYAGRIPFTKTEEEWMDEYDWHPVDERAFKPEFIKELVELDKHSKVVKAKNVKDLFG